VVSPLDSAFHARARTDTLRRHLIVVPARIARRARRIILHLPHNWPYRDALDGLFTATHAPSRLSDQHAQPPQRRTGNTTVDKLGRSATSAHPPPDTMINNPGIRLIMIIQDQAVDPG